MAINSILNNTLSNTAQKFLGINTQRVGQSIESSGRYSGARHFRCPSVRYPLIEAGGPEYQ